MFNKSPYLDGFPVLAIKPDALSTYGMRVANSEEHLCTAEVAACVLEVAGELKAGQALQHWFNLFSRRYMAGRVSRFPGDDEAPLLAALSAIKGSEAESPRHKAPPEPRGRGARVQISENQESIGCHCFVRFMDFGPLG